MKRGYNSDGSKECLSVMLNGSHEFFKGNKRTRNFKESEKKRRKERVRVRSGKGSSGVPTRLFKF